MYRTVQSYVRVDVSFAPYPGEYEQIGQISREGDLGLLAEQQ